MTTPELLAVSMDGSTTPIGELARRFLASRRGLLAQVSRPWAIATIVVAPSVQFLPYGEMEPSLELRCGPIPSSLFVDFAQLARAAHPTEAGAWITWSQGTRKFLLRAFQKVESRIGRLDFERPRLAEGEWLVVDLHSHGAFDAFFSELDDDDDRSEYKISVVLGRCDEAHMTVAARLCCYGAFAQVPAIEATVAIAIDGLRSEDNIAPAASN